MCYKFVRQTDLESVRGGNSFICTLHMCSASAPHAHTHKERQRVWEEMTINTDQETRKMFFQAFHSFVSPLSAVLLTSHHSLKEPLKSCRRGCEECVPSQGYDVHWSDAALLCTAPWMPLTPLHDKWFNLLLTSQRGCTCATRSFEGRLCEGACEHMCVFVRHTNIVCMLCSISKHKHTHCTVCVCVWCFSNFFAF